jgi:hypothetical protein
MNDLKVRSPKVFTQNIIHYSLLQFLNGDYKVKKMLWIKEKPLMICKN